MDVSRLAAGFPVIVRGCTEVAVRDSRPSVSFSKQKDKLPGLSSVLKAPLVYLSLGESTSVVSSPELLGLRLPPGVCPPTCLHFSLVKTFPDVACKRRDFIRWKEDKMVSSEIVFMTVWIWLSVRAMTG